MREEIVVEVSRNVRHLLNDIEDFVPVYAYPVLPDDQMEWGKLNVGGSISLRFRLVNNKEKEEAVIHALDTIKRFLNTSAFQLRHSPKIDFDFMSDYLLSLVPFIDRTIKDYTKIK